MSLKYFSHRKSFSWGMQSNVEYVSVGKQALLDLYFMKLLVRNNLG